jgi:hypothetical protein
MASAFSSSRSRWNTKCKKDASAPPIWLRRALNDTTNVEFGSSAIQDDLLLEQTRYPADTFHANHPAALEDGRLVEPHPRIQYTSSSDASDLHLNPHAFSNHEETYERFRPEQKAPSALVDGGSYAAIHRAVPGASHQSRAVQSARRTRVSEI